MSSELTQIALKIGHELGWSEIFGEDDEFMYIKTLITNIGAGNEYVIQRFNTLSK